MRVATALATAFFLCAAPAGAQQPQHEVVASCYLAAENMRDRVRVDAEDYPNLHEQTEFWRSELVRHVPDAEGREESLRRGRATLAYYLGQQSYMAGMIMVSNVLTQCRADRERLQDAR